MHSDTVWHDYRDRISSVWALNIGLFLFLFSFALLFTNFPTYKWPGGDGRDYANITDAIVEGQSLDLRNAKYSRRRNDDPTVIELADGSLYSIFPLGKPLIQVPALAAMRRVFSDSQSQVEKMLADNLAFSITSAVLYGVSGVLMFILLKTSLGFSVPCALLGVVLYAFSTLALPFSKIHGVENLQIVLLMGMVIAGISSSRWSIVALAACFGWLVLAKPPSAVALPTLVYLIVQGRLWQNSHLTARLIALSVALLFASLFFYYNWIRSGDISASYGVGAVAETRFALSHLPSTLWPLFFGPERNIFINNPILLLALPGFFLCRNRVYLLAALSLWVTMLVFYGASGNQNWGSYVGNARYTVPYLFLLIPFVIVFLVRVFRFFTSRVHRRWLLAMLLVLCAASVYVQALYYSFSEFHVKQFERAYNRFANELTILPLEESKHQLRFANTLFWNTKHCTVPSKNLKFNYPSSNPDQAHLSTQVLRLFPQRWFCKDYLFLSINQFGGITWLFHLRTILIAMVLLSALLVGFAMRAKGNYGISHRHP